MCGIAGIISFRGKLDTSLINKMTDVIKFRGPDDEGAISFNFTDKSIVQFKRVEELNSEAWYSNLVLGHRRLSIIDLSSSGHQPLSYADGNLWITYNGEIYNYVELKEELKNYGYEFKTKTDTEVILAAYHKWGEDCLSKFNGMWSFAILDLFKDKIFCSVDQFGIKPFFYFLSDEYFCFSSEIKQLFQLPFIKKEFNDNIIRIFGYNRFDEEDNLIFKQIEKLKAGDKIILKNISLSSKNYELSRWHRFNTVPSDFKISEENAAERFRELFSDSVRLRLRSDVKVGTALSGGIDSSLIVMTMDKILKESNIKDLQYTFTAGSEDSEINEIPFANIVIDKTNTKGFNTIPKSEDFVREFEKMYYHIELPYISSSSYASWCVYKLARENGVTVTLDGQGSDELLAGYDAHMYPYYQMDFFLNGKWEYILPNSKEINRQYSISKLSQITQILKADIKNSIFVKEFYDNYRIKKDKIFNKNFINNIGYINGGKIKNNNFGIFDIFAKNLDDYFYNLSLPVLLHTVDRNSMAHSIEARLPFLDYRLVEFIYSLPHELKIKKGITKYILKKAYSNLLPDNIIKRKKIGFDTAEKRWFKQQKKWILEFVGSNLKYVENYLDRNSVLNLFNDNLHFKYTQSRKWDVLSFIVIAKALNVK